MKRILGYINLVLSFALLGFAATVCAQTGQKLVVFGASGSIGSLITSEALNRGYQVVGVSRNPQSMDVDSPNFVAVKGDVTDPDSFRELVQGADGVVISVQGNTQGNDPEQSTHALAAKVAVEVLGSMDNAPYVLQIGGATTLYNDPGIMADNLPFAAEPGSEMWGMFFGHWVALEAYRASDIAWTVLTPPMLITGLRDGSSQRTGQYRTAANEPVVPADGGRSTISSKDLAVAAIDEFENKAFVGRRFTVGY